MKIRVSRDLLVGPVTTMSNIVDKKQTLPILSNILLQARNDQLVLTVTDMEQELRTRIVAESDDEVEFTLPARKLADIARALPEGAELQISLEKERAVIRSGKSRFTLGTLRAADYPAIDTEIASQRLRIQEGVLKGLLERTQFAMANQDVRYYLNGLNLEVRDGMIRAVATDGHRMAISEQPLEDASALVLQSLIPRKSAIELGRLLSDSDREIEVEAGQNHIRLHIGDTVFTTKLIDGKFPDYERVVPRDADKVMRANKDTLKQTLARVAILSNESYKGVSLTINEGVIQISANNPEQEEAEEEIEVEYEGPEVHIGFNVAYLIEVIGAVEGKEIQMSLRDANSSCLIHAVDKDATRYVVMPIRL